MGEYVKRACSECGIMLPQPEMSKIKIVTGEGKRKREKEAWFCPDHIPDDNKGSALLGLIIIGLVGSGLYAWLF